MEKVSALILKTGLPKTSKSKLISDENKSCFQGLPDGFKYPGAKILRVVPTGQLASSSLVFPLAVGNANISLHFKKPTKVGFLVQKSHGKF